MDVNGDFRLKHIGLIWILSFGMEKKIRRDKNANAKCLSIFFFYANKSPVFLYLTLSLRAIVNIIVAIFINVDLYHLICISF